MEWINKKDELPESTGEYLVSFTSSNTFVTIAIFDDYKRKFIHKHTGNDFLTVNYWMPIPKPINF